MEKTFDEILTGAEQIEQKHSLWEVSERLKALAIDFRTQIHSVQANAEDKALDLLQIVEHYKDKLHLNADTEEKAFAFLTKVEEMSERMEQYANGLEAKVDEGQLQMHLAYSELLDRWGQFKLEFQEVFGDFSADLPLQTLADEGKVQLHLGRKEAFDFFEKSRNEFKQRLGGIIQEFNVRLNLQSIQQRFFDTNTSHESTEA